MPPVILQADARCLPLVDACVDCCVTSPPYFGLRDYGNAAQIGLEPTPEAFVASLVAVFREVRRVLKPHGTCWLNLGDSYYGAGQRGDQFGAKAPQPTWSDKPNAERGHKRGTPSPVHGLKFKDLMGMPWMVAKALQAPDYRCEVCGVVAHVTQWQACPPSLCDFEEGVLICPQCNYMGIVAEVIPGWYLRSDIIWSKPNPMPESVTDRPTKAHEYLFLLAKSEQYYYDAAAIAEIATCPGGSGNATPYVVPGERSGRNANLGGSIHLIGPRDTRNKRSVWIVATQPYGGAHFATFPEKLIEPCILAGCPVGGLVLDPFFGSGTVGVVAQRHQRRWIGTDLAYHDLAQQRTSQVQFDRLVTQSPDRYPDMLPWGELA
jgi:DNA modification methylase